MKKITELPGIAKIPRLKKLIQSYETNQLFTFDFGGKRIGR